MRPFGNSNAYQSVHMEKKESTDRKIWACLKKCKNELTVRHECAYVRAILMQNTCNMYGLWPLSYAEDRLRPKYRKLNAIGLASGWTDEGS